MSRRSPPPPARAARSEPLPPLANPAGAADRGWLERFWPLLVIGVTFAAYARAWTAGFIWNDSDYVTAPHLQSWSGLWRIWFQPGATQQYYPLLHSAFWLEHRLWGDASTGYHLCNILLHAIAACLFVVILRQLWGRLGPALLAGLIFALHPVCVESVAWITEQKNTLSTVFYLLAALAYLSYRQVAESGDRPGARRGRYALGLALFAAAVLSKSVAASLPGALLVMLWWRQGRLAWRRDVLPLVPWFVVGAAGGLYTGWFEKTLIGAEGSDFALTPLDRVLVAGRVIWFYLGKLSWPTGLIFFYPRWHVDAGVAWQYLFPFAVLALLAALAGWAWRIDSTAQRAPLAAILLFIGALFPLLGFFNVYAFVFSYVADHWQYLALFGPIALAAGAWQRWRDRWAGRPAAWRALPPALALAVLGGLAVLTSREAGVYRNLDVFYHTILARNPASWISHNNLGNTYYAQGRSAEAKREYEDALRLKPDYPEAHNNLGVILVSEGRFAEAVPHYLEAMRIVPAYADAHNNYGIVLGRQGQLAAARAEFETAVRLKPDNLEAQVNIGNSLLAARQYPEAIAAYEAALRIAPQSPEAHNNLGVALQGAGRYPEAIEQIKTALHLRPAYAGGEHNLGDAYRGLRQWTEALEHYRAAVRLRPDFAAAWDSIGSALLVLGRGPEAVPALETAIRLDPGLASARENLGSYLFSTGRTAEAIVQFQAAARIAPLKPENYNNLGIAYFQARRRPEAEAQFREAVRLKPDFADAQNNLGAVLVDLGRNEEAIPHYRVALRLVPNYPEAHNNLSVALMGLGRLPEAEAECREAMRFKPNLANAHSNLAKILRKTGRSAEADREAKEAERLAGRGPTPAR